MIESRRPASVAWATSSSVSAARARSTPTRAQRCYRRRSSRFPPPAGRRPRPPRRSAPRSQASRCRRPRRLPARSARGRLAHACDVLAEPRRRTWLVRAQRRCRRGTPRPSRRGTPLPRRRRHPRTRRARCDRDRAPRLCLRLPDASCARPPRDIGSFSVADPPLQLERLLDLARAASASPRKACRMPAKLEANASTHVRPAARLRSMLCSARSSPRPGSRKSSASVCIVDAMHASRSAPFFSAIRAACDHSSSDWS